MKLFMIYIGGRTAQSLIELHDMRFVIANRIEDTYADLKKTWWGIPESLHLDCWGVLEYADGYQLHLKPKTDSATDHLKLYFINLGGHSREEFTELHKNIFIVAESEAEAKRKAVASVKDWQQGHKDYIYEVESAFCLNQLAAEQSMSLHLERVDKQSPFTFDFGYVPIGKK